jgi:hypothetical protein
VGLTGEVRAVSAPEVRLKEGHKLGFKRALLARRQQEHLGSFPGLELIGVETLAAAIRSIFPWGGWGEDRGERMQVFMIIGRPMAAIKTGGHATPYVYDLKNGTTADTI